MLSTFSYCTHDDEKLTRGHKERKKERKTEREGGKEEGRREKGRAADRQGRRKEKVGFTGWKWIREGTHNFLVGSIIGAKVQLSRAPCQRGIITL